MDPHTAYLRCHELQYNDYTSEQGLLEAMKDYQQKAPDHLSNSNLILMIQAGVATHLLNQEVAAIDPWIRVLTASKEDDTIDDRSAKLVGPTFKVDVEVEGVKTRAIADNGSQVTLVRTELFPKVREHNA